ncbi:MAG: hypothetical protein O8C61_05270 [Candidatus Methanoperedens sp.]|nr:hypothetical protein [Candidatus Methanoperedens sp.]
MRYSRGDVVEFKVGSNDKHTGQVQFVEEDNNENILYVDSFSGWAYKVPEKRIISKVTEKNHGTFAGNRRDGDLIYNNEPAVPGTSADPETVSFKLVPCTAAGTSEKQCEVRSYGQETEG